MNNTPDFAGAARAFNEFLAGSPIVTIVVMPGLCTGLGDFPPGAPLRIDLSEAFSPPMWPKATEAGLEFRASFSRVDRAVQVPWTALVWAGVPNVGATQAQVAKLEPPAPKPAVRDGKLIHVDFASRKKKT